MYKSKYLKYKLKYLYMQQLGASNDESKVKQQSQICNCGNTLNHQPTTMTDNSSIISALNIWPKCCCGNTSGGTMPSCPQCGRCRVFFNDNIFTICGSIDCKVHLCQVKTPISFNCGHSGYRDASLICPTCDKCRAYDGIDIKTVCGKRHCFKHSTETTRQLIFNCPDCNNNTTFNECGDRLSCSFCFCHRCHEKLTSLFCDNCNRCAFFSNTTGVCNGGPDNNECRFHSICKIGPIYPYECICTECSDRSEYCGECRGVRPIDSDGICLGYGKAPITQKTCGICNEEYNAEDDYCPNCDM